MAKKIPEILFNSFFSYDDYACICKKDISYLAPGATPEITLKLCCDMNHPLHFSYMAQKGLNLSGNAGGPIKTNVLGKLLAIKDGDIESYINFFEEYGFLIPISSDEYESIKANDIINFIDHIKATIRLMNAIAEKNDYNRILIAVTYLLYSSTVTLSHSNGIITSCPHQYTDIINTYSSFPDKSRDQEAFSTGEFSVTDTLCDGPNKVSMSFFNAIRSGTGIKNMYGSKSLWFKNLVAAYTGLSTDDNELRMIIDFYYHYQCECGIIKDVSQKKIIYYSKNDTFIMSEKMKVSLIKIARLIVSEELNFFISKIHPSLTPSTFEPHWKLNSLLEAIYFSIFYMKPGVEIYKECENPSCKREIFFLVNATTTNKKYCCPACANAAAQRRSRARKLSK